MQEAEKLKMSKRLNLLFYLFKEGDVIRHRGHIDIDEEEVEMLNTGKIPWFRKHSCNSK